MRRLCEVNINCPFASSFNIPSISPNKYSKIPESSSSTTRHTSGELYNAIKYCKREMIRLIPSDSYFVKNFFPSRFEYTSTCKYLFPSDFISSLHTDNSIDNFGIIDLIAILIEAMTGFSCS